MWLPFQLRALLCIAAQERQWATKSPVLPLPASTSPHPRQLPRYVQGRAFFFGGCFIFCQGTGLCTPGLRPVLPSVASAARVLDAPLHYCCVLACNRPVADAAQPCCRLKSVATQGWCSLEGFGSWGWLRDAGRDLVCGPPCCPSGSCLTRRYMGKRLVLKRRWRAARQWTAQTGQRSRYGFGPVHGCVFLLAVVVMLSERCTWAGLLPWQETGLTPLYIASEKGHVGVVATLLASGASVNKARAVSGAPSSR